MKCVAITTLPIYAESRPARGAWIEIERVAKNPDRIAVAPRTGRVD